MNIMAKWIAILAFSLSSNGDAGVFALCTAKATRGKIRALVPSFANRHATGQSRSDSLKSNPRKSYVILSSSPASSSPELSSSSRHNEEKTTRLDHSNSNDAFQSNESTQPPQLYSVDVRYNRRSPLTYDAASGRYLDVAQTEISSSTKIGRDTDTIIQKWGQFLHSAFVPEGVSQSYYRFMRWRIMQRFVNANVHVIGTQSLLMGLRDMQQGSTGVAGAVASAAKGGGAALGAAAATNWVLKDTLGKVVRMAWASKMGRKFDPDAKRWRFRASLIYALGNGLEVSTYLHPQYFLALAMLANSCKQMSMLTSSATRNALYNSFRRGQVPSMSAGANVTNSTGIRRDSGGIENIGDITAKGEAQIAVVDLLGIASGIFLSRAIGVSVQNVFAVWVVLQVMEIFCMYHEMRSIVYKTFNFERMYTVLGRLLSEDNEIIENNKQLNSDTTNITDTGSSSVRKKYKFIGHIPTPKEIAQKEKVFLPPDHLARRAIAFGSPGRTVLDPDEIDMLINDLFRGEKYFLVVGQDIKNERGLSARVRQWMRRRKEPKGSQHDVEMGIDPMEQCHIVLHADANNLDILKSALALCILRKKLVKKMKEERNSSFTENVESSTALRTRDCVDVLRESGSEASEIFPQLLRELTKQGWRPPLRSMLGRVSARADWPIQKKGQI